MPNVPIGVLIDLFAGLGCLFAFWKGGTAERLAAAAIVVNVAINQAAMHLMSDGGSAVRMVNDGLTAVALLGVTVRFGAPWMGGVMLFYAAQFALHSFYLVLELPPNDYRHALINNINFSGTTWCLIIGVAVAWRRRVKVARAAATAAETPAT